LAARLRIERSGVGGWAPGNFQGGDSTLNAGPPENETLKLAYVQPVAGSVPLGTQKVLQVNWQVDNFTGAGTTASSTARIDGTCTLGPVGFTTTRSAYAYPRMYAPSSAGCGYQIKLDYTISLVSGQVSAAELQAIEDAAIFYPQDDDTLEHDEHAKVLIIFPIDTYVSTTDQVVLRVNWIASDGNAMFGVGDTLVTIDPD